ncbi:unnamed protein product [Parnassius apollo]|uniref:(apollo) hypothetical protein n=1 Tax=Parnassius apollo TaxID=110799 RepID=A0A8S3XB03_PARAO|nr:unnamed protein product [Parnassius apollo]
MSARPAGLRVSAHWRPDNSGQAAAATEMYAFYSQCAHLAASGQRSLRPMRSLRRNLRPVLAAGRRDHWDSKNCRIVRQCARTGRRIFWKSLSNEGLSILK